jgi:hypothetical protein
MEFDVEWDQEHEIALIKHTRLILDSNATVKAWRERLFTKLEAIRSMRGKKFPIVVCIDNFMIRPKVADAYGGVVREMIDRFATAVARYGEPSTVKQIIAVEAMKEGFRANLFETFEQAIDFFSGDPSGAPPTSRSLRIPLSAGSEVTPPRSLPPRAAFRSVASASTKQSVSEDPSVPMSRRPERITIR